MNISSEKLLLASRVFTSEDQEVFAEFSGDFNPIHMDAVFARRTISGQCVVHGIHGLMWALDSLMLKTKLSPSSIEVTFSKPIFLGEELNCFYNKKTNQLIIKKDSLILFEIILKFNSIVYPSSHDLKVRKPLKFPVDRDANDLATLQSQEFFYRGDQNLAFKLFPNISNIYCKNICCEIASISEIIGMHAPGLHSLLLSAKINFQISKEVPNFDIKDLDKRFKLLNIVINNSSLICQISALLRQKPANGPLIIDLKKKVHNSEFKNIRALVIGGSRGLGESTAKIIAAGCGESVITYSSGYSDCNKVSKEINDSGERCSIAKVSMPNDIEVLAELGEFNQVYYFPTPKIFGKRSLDYDEELYANFHEIYVGSFKKLLNHFNKQSIKTSIFYPSTAAIDNPLPELSEYIDAKKAGENLCKESDHLKNLSIHISRIPRAKTDQSISLLQAESKNPEQVMLPIIREMLLSI